MDDETYKLSFDVYSQYYTAITVAIQDSTLSGGWANVRTECNVIEKNGKFYLEQESDKRQITAITLIDDIVTLANGSSLYTLLTDNISFTKTY